MTTRLIMSTFCFGAASFDEPGLAAKGKFKAAGTSYNQVSDVDIQLLRGWLEKSKSIQWDYKNLRRNNDELHKITSLQ